MPDTDNLAQKQEIRARGMLQNPERIMSLHMQHGHDEPGSIGQKLGGPCAQTA